MVGMTAWLTWMRYLPKTLSWQGIGLDCGLLCYNGSTSSAYGGTEQQHAASEDKCSTVLIHEDIAALCPWWYTFGICQCSETLCRRCRAKVVQLWIGSVVLRLCGMHVAVDEVWAQARWSVHLAEGAGKCQHSTEGSCVARAQSSYYVLS